MKPPLQPRSETVRLDGPPQMNAAGNMTGLLLIGWPFLLVAAVSAIGGGTGSLSLLPGRQAIGVLTLVAIAVPWVAYLWVGSFVGRATARRRMWRWMFAHPQPGATLDQERVEFRAPNIGTERFEWDEIAGMEPSIWWMRSSFATGTPDLELKTEDGRVLLRVPSTIYAHVKPEGSGWRPTSPRTLAEYIVTARPDRYVLIDTHPDGHHYWFELASAAADRATAAAAVELGQLAAGSGRPPDAFSLSDAIAGPLQLLPL